MSKFIKFLLLALAVLVTAHIAAAGSVTVGTYSGLGNCYPFMCNDSGTSVGLAIDYQQVYASTAFPGSTTVSSISWYYQSGVGTPTVLGGSYTFEWGYASSLGLSSDLASNYISGPNVIGTATVPAGGSNYGSTLTLSGFSPFTYDPADGDLLLEIIVMNQDNVPNNSGNGYNEADYTGEVTSRAYCLADECAADSAGLVTTFNANATATPEPSSLVLFGTCFLVLAPLGRKLFGR